MILKYESKLYQKNFIQQDEPGEEQVIDEDFHGVFDENLFQYLVADDNLDPDLKH